MPKLLHLVFRDKEDLELCKKAAQANDFSNTSDWFRAIINGHLHMMGWRKLKYVSRRRIYCKRGHEYTQINTIWRIKGKYKFKVCRTCLKESWRKFENKRRKIA